ncbi:hypothetical protein NXW94_30550 [Bacteroides ovatus]|nr:hypothetical protein [Bacteroides ovatus]
MAGRIAYNWNYRYFVDFNFGYNGSENFAKGHHLRFPSEILFSLNIAEESFIKKNSKWLGMFKVCVSLKAQG